MVKHSGRAEMSTFGKSRQIYKSCADIKLWWFKTKRHIHEIASILCELRQDLCLSSCRASRLIVVQLLPLLPSCEQMLLDALGSALSLL